ncbi:MAG: methyltransferase domain-containing protein [Tissierellales bacterium]|nr:methyltransferase domain-containing protein [Tissierellales bacterium]
MKINFGCGKRRIDGYIGVDKIQMPTVDVVHDMNSFPYPFNDESVEEVILSHILEHLPNTVHVMEEIWRICRPEAMLEVDVPYYNSPSAYDDPTHVSFFTEHTFDYFTEDGTRALSGFNYYSFARFKIHSIIPYQRKIFSLLPVSVQWFLGHHFATIHAVHFSLERL